VPFTSIWESINVNVEIGLCVLDNNIYQLLVAVLCLRNAMM
jgi:hypothetical protein